MGGLRNVTVNREQHPLAPAPLPLTPTPLPRGERGGNVATPLPRGERGRGEGQRGWGEGVLLAVDCDIAQAAHPHLTSPPASTTAVIPLINCKHISQTCVC